MIGQTIGRYRITESLGTGVLGERYLADDIVGDRRLELEILEPEAAASATVLRLQREVGAIASLDHPGVVATLEVGERDGITYIATDHAPGESLADVLARGPLPVDQALDLARQALAGLARVHEAGIVHRDLHPGNLIVTGDGRVRLKNLGLPRFADLTELAQQDADVDALAYLSPEQARGREADARSDLYSLGVVLYEMITGRRPFGGAHAAALQHAITSEALEPMKRHAEGVDPQLEVVVRRLMAKDPANRYQTAAEAVAEIEAARARIAAPAPEAAAPPRSSRRRPVAATAAVVVLALVAAVFLLRRGAGPATDAGPPLIAVLPLTVEGLDDDALLARGISADLSARLASFPGLEVMARRSVEHAAEAKLSVDAMADDLGVDRVLRGTLDLETATDGEQVRIAAELIRARDGTPLWSETFEGPADDLFARQADIAAAVAGALGLATADTTRPAPAGGSTADLDAYRSYLRGMELLDTLDPDRDELLSAARFFAEAATLDPAFALAHARFCQVHARLAHAGGDRMAEHLSLAKAAVNRALALDPGLPEAWLALGDYYSLGLGDQGQALAALESARERAPRDVDVDVARGRVLRRQGDPRASATVLAEARPRSPLDPVLLADLAASQDLLRRYEDAARTLEEVIELAPDRLSPYLDLALVHLRRRGDAEAAHEVLGRVPTLSTTAAYHVNYLADLFGREYRDALARLQACPEDVVASDTLYRPVALLEGMARQLAGEEGAAQAAHRSARILLEKRLAAAPDDFRAHASLGLALAGLGQAAEALRHGERAVALHPLERHPLTAPVIIADLALVHATIGDPAAAVQRLDEVLSIPSEVSVGWLRHDPRWDRLREEPAFRDLLERHAD